MISIPDAQGRYYLLPDAGRLDHRVRDARQTHHRHRPAEICDHRPRLEGQAPAGVKEYKSPTSMVWLLGRIYCTGTPEDYKAVHAMQDKCSARPAQLYGKPYTPPPGQVDPGIDMKTAVREQVNAWMWQPISSCWPR